MYNLDFGGAHTTFGAISRRTPKTQWASVSNAAAYLFSEFDRLHILESDLFIDDHKFDGRSKLTPDPAIKIKFENELAKSTGLASKILAQNPEDKNALLRRSWRMASAATMQP